VSEKQCRKVILKMISIFFFQMDVHLFMLVVGLKHKEPAPADCNAAEKWFAKQSDH